MTTLQRGDASLWTRGMIAVLIAQFLSAMADNALLFAALALLKSKHFPVWAGPLLQATSGRRSSHSAAIPMLASP